MMKLARGRRSLITGGAALLALVGLALTAAPASAAQHAPATPSHFKVHKINVLGSGPIPTMTRASSGRAASGTSCTTSAAASSS
jgi:hypothetical protein